MKALNFLSFKSTLVFFYTNIRNLKKTEENHEYIWYFQL